MLKLAFLYVSFIICVGSLYSLYSSSISTSTIYPTKMEQQ